MNPNSPPFVPKRIPDNFGQQPANSMQNFEQSSSVSLALNQLANLQAQQTQLSSTLVNQQRTFHLPVKLRHTNVLSLMLFNVSCNHSLKKSQIETKRVGNKRKSLQLQEVFPFAAH